MGGKIIPYTSEEKQFLIVHFKNFDCYEDLKNEFNKYYNTRSFYGIKQICHKLGLFYKINLTRYGQRNANKGHIKTKIGDEFFNKKTNSLWIKTNDINVYGKNERASRNSKNWTKKDIYVWEKYYNEKLTKCDFLIHLDGNPFNCDIDNLYKSNLKVHNILLNDGVYEKHNKEFTLANIELIELRVVLRNKYRIKNRKLKEVLENETSRSN